MHHPIHALSWVRHLRPQAKRLLLYMLIQGLFSLASTLLVDFLLACVHWLR